MVIVVVGDARSVKEELEKVAPVTVVKTGPENEPKPEPGLESAPKDGDKDPKPDNK